MGKKRTAARRAAAAATTASTAPTAPPLSASAAPEDDTVVRDHPEPQTAPAHQQHDAHVANTCLAPRVSSLAPLTSSLMPNVTTETTPGISAACADPAALAEPERRPATTTSDLHDPRSPTTYHAARAASPASHTHTPRQSDAPTPSCRTTRTLAAGNEMESELGARRDGLGGTHGEYTPHVLRHASAVQHISPARPTTSPASSTRAAAQHDAPASPSSTTNPRAAENESEGLVGTHEDDPHALHACLMPHVPHLAQHALPTASNDVSAPKHNAPRPPTPGIEPGEPRMAAAYESPDPEPAFVDREHHDKIVAIAIQKGYEAGLKTG